MVSQTSRVQIWIMRLAAALLCLNLFAFWMICQMYAKYTTGDSGSDSARVARFSVTESNSLQSCSYAVVIDPDTPKSLSVEITNNSETTVKYTLSFMVEGNLPLVITPDGSSGAGSTLTQNETTNVWTTTKAANWNTTETYTFDLQLNEKGYRYSGGAGMITVTLTAEQVD